MTDDDIALAGELALGLLDGQERADALRRMLAEPGFAREVGWWRDRLAGLALAVPEAEGAPDLAEPAVLPAPSGPVRLWQAIAGVTTLAAVGAVAVLLLQAHPAPVPAPVPQPTPLVAALSAPGSTGYGAIYDPATSTLHLLQAPQVTAGRQAVAWLIVGTAPPRAIGPLRSATRDVVVPDALRASLGSGATVAISLEPADRPIGPAPAGPVVAAGALQQLG